MTKLAGPELNLSTRRILGNSTDQIPPADHNCTWVWNTFHTALHSANPEEDDGLVDLLNSAWQVCTKCMIAEHEAEQFKNAYQQAKIRQANIRVQMQSLTHSLSKPDQKMPEIVSENAKLSLQLEPGVQDCNAKELAHDIQKQLISDNSLSGTELKKNIHNITYNRASDQPHRDDTVNSQKAECFDDISAVVAPSSYDKENQTLRIYTLGNFRIEQNNKPVNKMGNSKSKALLKYLLSNHHKKVFKEILMDTFWPVTDPAHAKNSLNVAIHGIRHALPETADGQSYILFENGCYFINPDIEVWIDAEQFQEYIEQGKRQDQQGNEEQAIEIYLKAYELYQGDFFEEDRYEDWVSQPAQDYKNSFQQLTERLCKYFQENENYPACIERRQKLLGFDTADEKSHREIMRCYYKMGQRHLAMRQFQLCTESLQKEYDLEPDSKTLALYSQIKAM